MTDEPDTQRFVGMWKLRGTSEAGKPVPVPGGDPTGLIVYDASGWMSAVTRPDRPAVGMAGTTPTGEEAQRALLGFTAYFGRYTVDPARRTVTHHRQANVQPGWESQPDLVRGYTFSGNLLILQPVGSTMNIVWERLGSDGG